jgi:hypothetical protein
MPDDKILSDEMQNEFIVLEVYIWASIQRTAITLEEYVKARLLQGTSLEIIKQDLMTDLNEGGRIFGEFKNSIKANAHGNIHRIRDDAEFSELGIKGEYRWSAVLINTCPDCLDRHGEVKTWEEWEEEGMPRTGATVCKEHCKCILIPADSSELAPIKRNRKPSPIAVAAAEGIEV